MKWNVLLAVILLGLTSCGDRLSPEEQELMLMDERWLLQEVRGTENYQIDEHRPNHIMFPTTIPGEARAFAGCNTISMRINLSGTDLEVAQMIRGNEECEDMGLEDKLFEVLEDMNGFRISNGTMELRQGRRTLATFERDTTEFFLPQRWSPGGN